MSQELKQYVATIMVPQEKRIMAYSMVEAKSRFESTMVGVYPKGAFILRIDENPDWASMFTPQPQLPRGV